MTEGSRKFHGSGKLLIPKTVMRAVGVRGEPHVLARLSGGLSERLVGTEVSAAAVVAPVSRGTDVAETLAELRSRALQQGREEGLREGRVLGQKEGREQGLQLGVAEGIEVGRRDAQAQILSSQQKIQTMLGDWEHRLATLTNLAATQLAQRVDQIDDDLIEICHDAVCQMLGKHVLDRACSADAVRTAISRWAATVTRPTGKRLDFSVHVNPSELEALRQDPDLLAFLERQTLDGVHWRADELVQLGGCVVRSEVGGLDARLETQLAALTRLLTAGRSAAPAIALDQSQGQASASFEL